MRSPSIAELALLARVLAPIAPKSRLQIAKKILAEVQVAESCLRVTGRSHPEFGDGSLMSRCLALSPFPEALANDPEVLSSLIVACEAMLGHRKM